MINPSQQRGHLRTSNKSAKYGIVQLFSFFCALASEQTFIKTHNTESRFVIGPETVLFCRCVHARFSPEMLQDVAVKGLIAWLALQVRQFQANRDSRCKSVSLSSREIQTHKRFKQTLFIRQDKTSKFSGKLPL